MHSLKPELKKDVEPIIEEDDPEEESPEQSGSQEEEEESDPETETEKEKEELASRSRNAGIRSKTMTYWESQNDHIRNEIK